MNKILNSKVNLEQFENKSLLIVDDDDPFRNRLSKAMENKGFLVTSASSASEAIQKVKASAPTFAIIDLRLNDGSGLDVVKEIHKVKADSRIVVLTGYGNIPTAVAAVKSGAIDYLAKPADAEDLEAALLADKDKKATPPENPMSADRVKWEHIQRVFELCERNVSETARRLNMHRRTLQRILSKRSPK
jgi:two-component system response regulator RegA